MKTCVGNNTLCISSTRKLCEYRTCDYSFSAIITALIALTCMLERNKCLYKLLL